MPHGIRGHVRQDEVGLTAEGLPEPVGRSLIHEIHLQDGDALDGIGRQQVDADDPALRHPPTDDLAPATRSDPQVYDRFCPLQQPEPFVELEQLVSGAAAVILGLGPRT